ncbi:hypothetical protein ABEF92_000859 [Exophiala dermatitidis]|uniref:Glycosyl transferase CAP10 domain-containing protein n=1 Tax=Exophiala dermatitidis (strain ATCC 34100 / CBS 525.76 / NIH/UT8656) TaxID=858893 RepID=H6BP39_EXODN|nr:uncharacterized protein HMPREF1120_01460 [Exophiala dermatitidis NIH/UT8656]EHY53266.1 hypothetical protein HMPREF1120_01460 [Exophiala dermatitidis NIH/UT8656]
MGPIEINKRRTFLLLAAVLAFVILYHGLTLFDGNSLKDAASHISLPKPSRPTAHKPPTEPEPEPEPDESLDHEAESSPSPSPKPAQQGPLHPIERLMQEADKRWRTYESERSTTFGQVVEKYRSKYGRHPPPGFKDWYNFARDKDVFNLDDFEQIMDDLRPFWAIPPAEIRSQAAHMADDPKFGVAVIHIRNHKVVGVDNGSWRSETMVEMINTFIKHLPDMDIAMNRLDQPRVVVPWEDMQKLLQQEYEARKMPPEAIDSFSKDQVMPLVAVADTKFMEREESNPVDVVPEDKTEDSSTVPDYGWFFAPGKQYMDIAAKACPPGSPARSHMTVDETDKLYKESTVGFVSNFNLSSDLCTVGPTIQNLHGLLYSASSIIASHKLVPIFGECKVNVNSDILFPANMYYRHDDRYDYDPSEDFDWQDKRNRIIWRGVTSGGVQTADNWQTMHRQRLVQLFNGTHLAQSGKEVKVLREKGNGNTKYTYEPYDKFQPSQYAEQHSDIGFVESWGCVPDCSFYDTVFSWKPQVSLGAQFKSKYLIDVDGHSFSGRWRAFLESKSLGLKATIFREWHDSRLFAWRHFVPVDNRYDDLYALMTYFTGYGYPGVEYATEGEETNPDVRIARHDKQAQKLALQGREWANKVLRREDIEVYMFRLLLEYGRIIDDNRDYIGYSGDGSELDKYDDKDISGKSGWFGRLSAGWSKG